MHRQEAGLMSASSDAIARRFGDGGPACEGAEDNDVIRRVLSRKTVRRYSDRMPTEELLDLLVASALSASAKSDFQQASILRVRDLRKRAAIGELSPITGFPNGVTRAAAILGLPDLVFPVAGLCLGYQQAEGYVSLRLPRGVTTHSGSYDDRGLCA